MVCAGFHISGFYSFFQLTVQIHFSDATFSVCPCSCCIWALRGRCPKQLSDWRVETSNQRLSCCWTTRASSPQSSCQCPRPPPPPPPCPPLPLRSPAPPPTPQVGHTWLNQISHWTEKSGEQARGKNSEIHIKIQRRDLTDRRSSQFTQKQELFVAVTVIEAGVKNDPHTE